MIEKHNKTLDRARATLDEVEAALVQASASDGELRRLRDRVEPLPLDLQNVIDHLTPRLQAIDARLQELGSPSPDAKSDASPPRRAPAPAPRARAAVGQTRARANPEQSRAGEARRQSLLRRDPGRDPADREAGGTRRGQFRHRRRQRGMDRAAQAV